MAWAILEDGVVDHEKFLALESDCGLSPIEALAAVGLWAKANGWCARSRTDGFIPRSQVPKLAPAGLSSAKVFRLADALVAARGRKEHGLWEPREGGFQVHDFTDHNYSLAEIEAKREAGRKGGKSRAARLARAQAGASPSAQAGATARAQAMTGDVPSPHRSPDAASNKLPPVDGLCAQPDRQAGRKAGDCAMSFNCPRRKHCEASQDQLA